jgi:hypothetical protein
MEKLKTAGRWVAKNILPWLALFIAATTDGIGEGVLHFPAWLGSLLISGAGVLGIAGISPFPVTPTLARLFGLLSAGAAAVLAGHAAGQIWPPPSAHIILFHIVGGIGVLLGVIGGRQGARAVLGKPPLDTSSTVTPLDRPPPSSKT